MSIIFTNIKKNTLLILQLTTFIILYLLSNTVFKNVYLYKWTADHLYLYIWIPVIILTILNKKYISLSLTIGNLVGIIIGELLGEYIRNENIKKITEITPPHEVYRLQSHYGFFIWLLILLTFLIAGILVQKKKT